MCSSDSKTVGGGKTPQQSLSYRKWNNQQFSAISLSIQRAPALCLYLGEYPLSYDKIIRIWLFAVNADLLQNICCFKRCFVN